MNWRRITGSVLAAFLLLATALPSMCGECLKITVADACSEKHGTAVHEGHSANSTSATHTKCETCSGERQVAVKRIELQDATPAILLSRGALNHCPDSVARSVLLAGPQLITSHPGLINLAIASASPRGGVLHVQVVQGPASPFSNKFSPKLPAHPLLIALKI